jgi:hypothetical protein
MRVQIASQLFLILSLPLTHFQCVEQDLGEEVYEMDVTHKLLIIVWVLYKFDQRFHEAVDHILIILIQEL